MHTGYVIQRWGGSSWYDTMLSPYKTMSEVNQYLKDYAWHFTADNPYRIKDHKPKKKVQQYSPKYNAFQDWNSDKGMVVK